MHLDGPVLKQHKTLLYFLVIGIILTTFYQRDDMAVGCVLNGCWGQCGYCYV